MHADACTSGTALTSYCRMAARWPFCLRGSKGEELGLGSIIQKQPKPWETARTPVTEARRVEAVRSIGRSLESGIYCIIVLKHNLIAEWHLLLYYCTAKISVHRRRKL